MRTAIKPVEILTFMTTISIQLINSIMYFDGTFHLKHLFWLCLHEHDDTVYLKYLFLWKIWNHTQLKIMKIWLLLTSCLLRSLTARVHVNLFSKEIFLPKVKNCDSDHFLYKQWLRHNFSCFLAYTHCILI